MRMGLQAGNYCIQAELYALWGLDFVQPVCKKQNAIILLKCGTRG